MTSVSQRTCLGWSPAASDRHVAFMNQRRPVLLQTFRRYFRQLRRWNPSIQVLVSFPSEFPATCRLNWMLPQLSKVFHTSSSSYSWKGSPWF
ncbi:unnamed protein product [Prunus armeniaca]